MDALVDALNRYGDGLVSSKGFLGLLIDAIGKEWEKGEGKAVDEFAQHLFCKLQRPE